MTRLVLLHGFAGSVETFTEVRAALDGTFISEAPALLGHGAESEAADFESEVDRLAKVVGEGPPPLLLGYSFGGRLAMGLVARHPARWRGAIFVGAHPGFPDARERERRRRADARWVELLRAGDLERFVDAWEAQPVFASQGGVDSARRARQRAARTRHDPHALARAMEVLGTGAMPCWEDALAASRTPMVFLAGALDAKYVAIGERLAERVSTLQLVVAQGAGHNVVLEAADRTAGVVRDLAARSGA